MMNKIIKLQQSEGTPIDISEEDFINNIVSYLREHFPKEECVIYEVKTEGNRTTEEGAAAVLSLIKNPQMINHYNTLIKSKI